MKPSKRPNVFLSSVLGLAVLGAAHRPCVLAQSAPAQAPSTVKRLLGTITATGSDSITLKLEDGGEATVAVGPQTRMVRTAPGEKTLAGATSIQLSDLTTGDRVLVRATAGDDATHFTASAVVAMKQADIAQAHASEAEDWQKRGVGGVVKSIEVAPAPTSVVGATTAGTGTSMGGAATVVLDTGLPGRTITLHVTPATNIRRYAADSVRFADSKPATLAEIHPGDQVRARGEHSAEGSVVTAVEVVAGSFRNIAGTITAIDAGQNTLTMNDLATKKPVVLKLTPETQMRKLPPEMAQRLAGRSSGAGGGSRSEGGSASAGAGPAGGPGPGGAGGGPGGSASGTGANHGREGGQQGGMTAEGAGQGSRPRGDMASMLQRAPSVTLAELKKGDAVMVVSTGGSGGATDGATAITLISGVEPLLQASPGASQNLFSASWNLEGGGGGAEAPQ